MKYWKVTSSDLTKKLDEWNAKFKKAKKLAHAFSKRIGASEDIIAMNRGFFGFNVSIEFPEEPDRTVWKKDGKSKYWLPKVNGPGKVFHEELNGINEQFPKLKQMYRWINFDFIVGMTMYTIGVQKYEFVWYVITPDHYMGCKGLRRISDLTYEKLEKAKEQ